MPRPLTADIVVLSAAELERLLSQHRAELLADLRKELAEVRPTAAPAAEVKPPAELPDRLVATEVIWKSVGMSRAKWFRLLRKYPELGELRRGKRWPIEAVKAAVAALG